MPMTALLVVVVLGFTAFAVDLGLNRVAARDMQAVADAVALDTARAPELSACNQTALTNKANQSLSRQNRRIGRESPLAVTPGRVDAAGQFTAASSGCNAVRVTARTEVDFAFAPVIGTDSGQAARSAVGTRGDPTVCFSAGTRTLVLNTSQSALGPLLDLILKVNLGVGGYDGLVNLKNLSVPLADLAVALDVGTVDGLANAEVSLHDFMLAVAEALPQSGNAVAIGALQAVAVQVKHVNVRLAEILSLGTGAGEGLGVAVNALDLVGAAIVAANGSNAIAANGLDIDLGPLVRSGISLSVIEPPQIACGGPGTIARSAQIRLNVDTRLLSLGRDLDGGFSAASVSLGINVARGSAELKTLSCEQPRTATVNGRAGLLTLGAADGGSAAKITLLGLLGGSVLEVRLQGSVGDTPPQASEGLFTFPTGGALPPSQSFGSDLSIGLRSAGTTVLGLPLGWLLDGILTPLLAVVGSALNDLVGPLLSALGIKHGTTDVSMLGAPTCSSVELVG